MEKPRFEEDIRSKLEGHSSNASPELWEKLERRLDASERSALIIPRFRYSAVAAMVALIVVSFSLWKMDFFKESKNDDNLVTIVHQPAVLAPLSNQNKTNESQPKASTSNSVVVDPLKSASHGLQKNIPVDKNFTNAATAVVSEGESINAEKIDRSPSLSLENTKVNLVPVDLHLSRMLAGAVPRDLSLAYKVADAVSSIKPRKKESVNKSSWLAVGFASGNYQQQVLAGNTDAGISRSSAFYYGRNFGRLALFSGLALSEQQYSKSSNLAYGASSARSAVSTDIITSGVAASSNLSATNTYLVNTQKRYLSVPVQAGWYVVDRKVKGMFSAGVMSDYFLSSTISDASGVLQSSRVRRGSEAAYAGWVFSGIVGSEWSMKFSERYQFAITPGVRYALTPVYRKDFVINGKSYAFDVGIRFRYFFDR